MRKDTQNNKKNYQAVETKNDKMSKKKQRAFLLLVGR